MLGTSPAPNMTVRLVQRRTAHVFHFRNDQEYAVFTLDQDPSRLYFALSIESSFGGFSYAWSHPGNCFYTFLIGQTRYSDYVCGKMTGRDEVFDGAKTSVEIRKELLQGRRELRWSKEEVREEWDRIPKIFDGVIDFHEWTKETELFQQYAAQEFYMTSRGPRARGFVALHQLFWPAFAKELEKLRDGSQ